MEWNRSVLLLALFLSCVMMVTADDDDDDDGDLARVIKAGPAVTVQDMTVQDVRKHLKDILSAIDTDHDGHVEDGEIREWMRQSAQVLRDHESNAEFEKVDTDDDNEVSWSEFMHHKYGTDDESSLTEEQKRDVKEDKALFDVADKDDDGNLDKEEHEHFDQPDEHKDLRAVLLKNTMERKDTNGDGVLTKDEFMKNDDEDEPQDTSADEFDEEDEDDDNKLDNRELNNWLMHDYTTEIQEAIQEIKSADDDKDGQFSYDEALEEPEMFAANPIMTMGLQLKKIGKLDDDDDDDDDQKHDEL